MQKCTPGPDGITTLCGYRGTRGLKLCLLNRFSQILFDLKKKLKKAPNEKLRLGLGLLSAASVRLIHCLLEHYIVQSEQEKS